MVLLSLYRYRCLWFHLIIILLIGNITATFIAVAKIANKLNVIFDVNDGALTNASSVTTKASAIIFNGIHSADSCGVVGVVGGVVACVSVVVRSFELSMGYPTRVLTLN